MQLTELIADGFKGILKSIGEHFTDLKTSITDAISSKAALETKITELNGTVSRQEQEIAGLKKVQADSAELQRVNAEQATAIAAKDAELAKLKAEATTVDEAAAKKSITMLSATGVPPTKLPKTDAVAPGSREELLAQYNALTDPKARGEFYQKNKKALLGQ